jgi:hypothetical protein
MDFAALTILWLADVARTKRRSTTKMYGQVVRDFLAWRPELRTLGHPARPGAGRVASIRPTHTTRVTVRSSPSYYTRSEGAAARRRSALLVHVAAVTDPNDRDDQHRIAHSVEHSVVAHTDPVTPRSRAPAWAHHPAGARSMKRNASYAA